MAEALALLAAVLFAFGSVLQQKGTLSTDAGGEDPRFLVQILRKPVWLAGGLCQAGGWVAQAAALDVGALVVVQSLTTLSLVIALPLGVWLTGQVITRKVLLGAACVLVGIALFLSVGSPQGGTDNPSASAWWTAGLASAGLMVLLATFGRRASGSRRALMFGAAAGIGFGLQAAVTKVFVGEVGQGLAHLLSQWSVYVLVASALAGFVLQQSALKTAALAPAMAASNLLTLVSGAVLGIRVFGESLSDGSGRTTPALIGLAVAAVGIVLLSSAPAATTDPIDGGPPPAVTGR